MKKCAYVSWAVFILVLLLGGCVPSGPEPTFFLPFTHEQALEKARAENKMVFLDFYADWCAPCKIMNRTTWQNKRVIQLLTEKTVPLKVDVDKNTDLALKYQVEVLPALLLLNPDGSVAARMGFLEGPELAAALEKSLANTNSTNSGRVPLEKK